MNKRILVIDDDEGILGALDAMLVSFGYIVETSSDGDVLKKLNSGNVPDLILLDVLLSGEDGRKLCRLIKNKENTKNIPILMISAHPTAEKDIKAYGADAFIEKPFEMEDLISKVEKYIKISRSP